MKLILWELCGVASQATVDRTSRIEGRWQTRKRRRQQLELKPVNRQSRTDINRSAGRLGHATKEKVNAMKEED